MENASKALIIAGAILLAILIIGLGVFIFGQAANSVGNTGMDQLAVQQFNSQFEPYEGTQTGSQVKQLLKTVISNNYTYSDDISMNVTVNGVKPNNSTDLPGSGGLNGKATAIGSGYTYKVSFPTRGSNGQIQAITITKI